MFIIFTIRSNAAEIDSIFDVCFPISIPFDSFFIFFSLNLFYYLKSLFAFFNVDISNDWMLDIEKWRLGERCKISPYACRGLTVGYPMGPLELADFVGLDVSKSIMDGKLWSCVYIERIGRSRGFFFFG